MARPHRHGPSQHAACDSDEGDVSQDDTEPAVSLAEKGAETDGVAEACSIGIIAEALDLAPAKARDAR